jgi:hypothetical protein
VNAPEANAYPSLIPSDATNTTEAFLQQVCECAWGKCLSRADPVRGQESNCRILTAGLWVRLRQMLIYSFPRNTTFSQFCPTVWLSLPRDPLIESNWCILIAGLWVRLREMLIQSILSDSVAFFAPGLSHRAAFSHSMLSDCVACSAPGPDSPTSWAPVLSDCVATSVPGP